MALMSSTRGVSFDPAEAAAARKQAAERQQQADAEIKRLRLRAEASSDVPPRKQHAIYLDQVESAWQERSRDSRKTAPRRKTRRSS